MFIGISNVISGIRTAGLSYIKDNLKLYLDFKSSRSDTLAFPSEGSTSFDGTNDEIKIADSSELQLSTLTISAWVKPNGASEDGYIFTKFDDSTSGGYALGILGSTNKIRLLSSGVSISQSDAVFVDDNVWVHVAVTVDGSGNLVYYRNGVSAGTASSVTLNTNSVGAVIGNRTGGSNTGHYFNGKMANVAIWSRALSLEEINSVMNKSYSQLGSVEKTSLVSWWALDSASNGVVQPASGEALGSEIMADGNFDSGISDFTNNDTGWVYRDNALGVIDGSATTGIFARANKSSGTIVAGALYKVQFTVVEESGGNLRVRVGAGSFTYIYDSGTYIKYIIAGSNTVEALNFYAEGNWQGYIDNVSVKKVTSNTGVVTGATTTTSVYGGNAPVLPRAIDIAESQAEQIGDGSALFERANNDYIDCGNILNSSWCSSSDFTIAVWVYPITNTVNGGIVGIRGSSGTTLQLYLQNGFKFKSYNETGASGETSALTTNVWTHVAMVQDGSNKKFYFNGILDTTTSQNPSNAGASESFTIGFTGNPSSNENFDGRLSQLGAWAGALTQSQVQEVLEATSFQKIPASVKSTLGSEVNTVANATSSTNETNATTGWGGVSTTNSSVAEGDTGSYSLKIEASASDGYAYSSGWTVDNGSIYKLSITWKTEGTETNEWRYGWGTSSGSGTYGTVALNGSTDWSTSVQYINTTSTSLHLFLQEQNSISNDLVLYVDSISIKKVTNDLVAYYPLDADSSRGNVTDNVVTGETLGSNVLSNGDFASGSLSSWNAVSGGSAMSVVNNSLVHAVGTSGGVRQSVTLTSGALYKGSFDILEITTGNNGNTTIPITIYPYDGSSAIIASTEYSIGTNTFYFIPTDNGIWFEWGTGKGFTVDNFTLKKVTSNTGVLK